ncbi:hypothetical protein ACFL59_09160 [Planctomycetota bacterium]
MTAKGKKGPKVSWASGEQGTREVLSTMTKIVADVVARIPEPALAILGSKPRMPRVRLFRNDDEDAQFGYFEEGDIYLNVSRCDRLPGERDEMVWTTAHEFGHAYLARIGFWSASWLQVEGHKANKEAINALRPWLGQVVVDSDFVDQAVQIQERLADAVALCWGFGQEYARSFPLDLLSKKKALGTDYLAAQVVEMHEVLQERLREASTE